MKSTLLMMAAIGCIACARSSMPEGGPPAAIDSIAVAAVPARGVHVVLVYEPQQGFACFGALQRWLAWGEEHPGRLRLIFAREPDRAEGERLALYRITPHLVVPRRVAARTAPLPSPYEYLVVDGRVAIATSLTSDSSTTPLLQWLSVYPLELASARPGDVLDLFTNFTRGYNQ